ncbi:hypothetical protein ALCH109712_00700 [Alkalicoccus chagannorensis]
MDPLCVSADSSLFLQRRNGAGSVIASGAVLAGIGDTLPLVR